MSGIEWTDETWNPLIGCSRVSAGCEKCYAERAAAGNVRRAHGGGPYQPVVRVVGGQPRWTNVVTRNSDTRYYWPRSIRPRTPALKIFVNSMSDLFHEQAIASGLTDDIFYEIRMAPGHIYQILTKRPEIAAAYYATRPEVCDLPGVWLGTSVEDARVKGRIDILRAIPAQIRFLSIEPLIGPVGKLDLTGIHWVIAGGESGKDARPMEIDWLREVRDQCVAQGIPFFFKQWGGLTSAKGGHEQAVLDGVLWKQFPQ